MVLQENEQGCTHRKNGDHFQIPVFVKCHVNFFLDYNLPGAETRVSEV